MRSTVFGAVLAGFVFGVALAQLDGTASAHVPHPGLNFWISVEGVPNCSTQNGDATCGLAPGSTFVIGAHLDPLPGDLPNYDGFDIRLRHAGVTPNHDASTNAWPDCQFPVASYDDPPQTDIVAIACAIGVPPAGPSSYTGLIGTVSFVCAASGSIALVHGNDNTDAVDDSLQPHAEDPNTTETLTINCVQGGIQPPPVTPGGGGLTPGAPTAPGPTLEPTAAAIATSTAQSQASATAKAGATATAKAVATAAKQTPTASGTKGGGGGGLPGWAIGAIIAGGVVAAGAAGAIGWRVMQARRAPGP